jgi:hypothetical protein
MTVFESLLSSKTKHTIDFSLVPLTIIVIEFSVFLVQLSSDSTISLENLVLLRLVHTVAMICISALVSRMYIWLKMPALSYRLLAFTGIFVLALGDITHAYLAASLGTELVDVYRRIGIVILQGSLWFPAIMIVLGNRREIVEKFKEYGQRLIVDTRVRSRTSSEFAELRRGMQIRIRDDLLSLCTALKEAMSNIETSSRTLLDLNHAMQSLLLGDNLRKFSRGLEEIGPQNNRRFPANSGMKSLGIFLQQFRILYATSLLRAPLSAWTYSTVLIALAAPVFVYFYSLPELLFSVAVIFCIVFFLARLTTQVQKTDSPKARFILSGIILIIGGLPFAADMAWHLLFDDPQPRIPQLITAIALPLTYFVSIAMIQVLRPKVLELIQKDHLRAGKALQEEVSRTISEELSQNLAHQWAVFIHGKILTRLAATSLKLESATKLENPIAFQETVINLKSLLNAPDAEFYDVSRSLESEVHSRLEPWVGLLEINVSIESTLKSVASSRVRDLGEVLEEMISNSIRHGKAKRIDLKLMRSGINDVELISVDDAMIAPHRQTNRTGLGTLIFNLASDGRWSIRRIDSSTEFRLIMGLES